MKNLITIPFLLLGFLVFGQSINKNTFSSSGGIVSNGTENIYFTIGEPIIDFMGSGPSVDQGFWATITEDMPDNEDIEPNIDISVYPNPVKNYFIIRNNIIEPYRATIYNLIGQLVLNQNIVTTNTETRIDISNFSSGPYMLSISNSKTTQFFKLLKE